MSDVTGLLARAERAGVRLDLDAGRLRCLAPAGVIDPALRAALSAERAALREHLAHQGTMFGVAEGPLSPGQEAMFFECLLDPASTAYNMDVVAHFTGMVDDARLKRALAALAARHPALRVRIVDDGDGPRQRVTPPADVPFTTAQPGTDIEAAFETFVATPFDVEGGALFRAALFPDGSDGGSLCLSLHHLVGDALSLGTIVRDLVVLYARPDALPPAADGAAAYLALADEERCWSQSAEHDAMLAESVALLTEPSPEQPPLGPGDGGTAGRIVRTGFVIDEGAAAALAEQARGAGASVFEWLLSTFGRAAARAWKVDDLAIGVLTAARPSGAAAEMVGYFVNAVPVRLRGLARDSRGTDIANARHAWRTARARARLPLAAIRRGLLGVGWPPQRRVFDIAFTHVGMDFRPVEVAGVTVGRLCGVTRRSKFPVNIQIQQDGGTWLVTVHLDPALVAADRVAALVSGWCRELGIDRPSGEDREETRWR